MQKYNGAIAILVDGARRVGKSFIVKKFAQNEYKSYVLLEFGKVGEGIKKLFENYLDKLDVFFLVCFVGNWCETIRAKYCLYF